MLVLVSLLIVLGCGGGGACLVWDPDPTSKTVQIDPGGTFTYSISSEVAEVFNPALVILDSSGGDPGIHISGVPFLYTSKVTITVDETVDRGKTFRYELGLRGKGATECLTSSASTLIIEVPL